MTNSSMTSTRPAVQPSRTTRWKVLIRVLMTAVVGACALVLAPAQAGAVVTEVGSVKVGLQPRDVTTVVDGAVKETEGKLEANPGAETFSNPTGNAVLHSSSLYAIYWDPTNGYHKEWQRLTNKFLKHLGDDSGKLSNVFANDGQYRDATNEPANYKTVFKVSYTDTAKYPTAGCTDPAPLTPGAVTCLTDAQLREQLQSFIAANKLPTGMNPVYYILTPPGVTVCVDAAATRCSDYTRTQKETEEDVYHSTSYLNSFCSYHGDINPDNATNGDANTVLYASVPWTAGTLGAARLPQVKGFECQDGGFDPTSKPKIEMKERPKVRSQKEEEEFEKDSPSEQEKILKEIELEQPHQQEPNQEGKDESGDFGAGLADLIINQIAVEQQNTITDPLLNAWQDSTHQELTDECRNFFASGDPDGSSVADIETEGGTLSNQKIDGTTYYLNNAFNLSATREKVGVECVGGDNLVPRFTAPNPVNAGEPIGFDGMESQVALSSGFAFTSAGVPFATNSIFSWNFGDGSAPVTGFAPGAPLCEAPWLSPCAASAFHTYQYGGTYMVTLTVTDVAGNSAVYNEEMQVNGPPAPGSSSSSSASGAATTTTSTTGGGSGSTTTAVRAPVAAAAVASHSLRTALKKGLVVRYSVNEQVAGHFEVLLSKALAKRLKIGGSPATGLPAGTPPQLVIAKAVLITTKGGHSTVTIKFSKTVAKRLSHSHKVPLLLRLIVRNAAKSPQSTTILSAVTLAG